MQQHHRFQISKPIHEATCRLCWMIGVDARIRACNKQRQWMLAGDERFKELFLSAERICLKPVYSVNQFLQRFVSAGS
jgi:hypothetical protein